MGGAAVMPRLSGASYLFQEGSEACKVGCVPKIDPPFRAPLITFTFLLRKVF